VFAVKCQYDFFGAYDVDADRGIVQTADHHELSGKKAWTWGTWDFGLVAQQNLTDEDGPYIEVQSGPLPTQSDYGLLAPRQEIAWQEWWYPVHGLGDGFEFATKDVAVQTSRAGGKLELRLLATSEFPAALCSLSRENREVLKTRIDLSPGSVQVVGLADVGDSPVGVTVTTEAGDVLASFTTPLPIPKVSPPDPSKFEEKPDDQLTVEEKYLKGRKHDRDTNRLQARKYYEFALAADPGHVASLRALAVLDLEAGLYEEAALRLEKALERDPDDGLSWYFLGVCRLRTRNVEAALDCAHQAARQSGTITLGLYLAGRASMRLGKYDDALEAFERSETWASDPACLARYARGDSLSDGRLEKAMLSARPSNLVVRAVLALEDDDAMDRFVRIAKANVGEHEFNMLEVSLLFADLGLVREAARLLDATCVEPVPKRQRSPLPLYYLAYYASLQEDEAKATEYLSQAAAIGRDFVFPSRPETVDVLEYAVAQNPQDANAHLHLGNLLGGLGRVEEAVAHWEKAAELNPKLSVALRNLGVAAAARGTDLPKAAEFYRRAIAARPGDQTLYRDLAEILIAEKKRPEAINLLETMPVERMRRADVTIMLAQAYLDEERYTETLDLLDSTPYFVHWEGQDVTWAIFNKASVGRGRKRLDSGELEAALADFEAALTYPANLGVGRSNRPPEAAAQYWRGKALAALGRGEEARAAWKEGAAGHEGSEEQNKHRKLCQEALEQPETK
ncbi:MAG: DUF5107 domain-containing protein, partial [Planctomycetota bacterium]